MTQINTFHHKKTYTYKDYAQLPENAPYELINGQLVEEPAPTYNHQKVSKNLFVLLHNHAEVRNQTGEVLYAPLDVYLEATELFQPDLVYIANDQKHIIKNDKIEGAPYIVFEILSPSTAYYDLRHKKDIYAKHGVKEYWIIDPMDQSIEVYEQNNGAFEFSTKKVNNGKLSSTVLKDFTTNLEEIF